MKKEKLKNGMFALLVLNEIKSKEKTAKNGK